MIPHSSVFVLQIRPPFHCNLQGQASYPPWSGQALKDFPGSGSALRLPWQRLSPQRLPWQRLSPQRLPWQQLSPQSLSWYISLHHRRGALQAACNCQTTRLPPTAGRGPSLGPRRLSVWYSWRQVQVTQSSFTHTHTDTHIIFSSC